MTKILSSFLFADLRFLFGVASSLDLGANFNRYNISRNGTEADTKAILADWYVVGSDLFQAIQEMEREQPPHGEAPSISSTKTLTAG